MKRGELKAIIRECLNEASFSYNMEAEVSKIANLTDHNHHVEALIAGAKLVKNYELEQIFTGCKMIQDAMGHLPSELGKIRTEAYNNLMKYAKSKMSDQEYEMFHDAF